MMKKEVQMENSLKYQVIAVNKIYNKLFLLAMCIFLKNEEGFYKVVRATGQQQVDFFKEAVEMYEQMSRNKNSEFTVEDFSRKIFENDQVADQLLFFLDFNFKQYNKDLF